MTRPDCVEHVIELPRAMPPVLAMGAWFKNTLCVTSGQQAFISHSVGDLDTPEACHAHERTARSLLAWLSEKPHAIVHDLHPDFHSSRFAAQLAAELDVPLIAVQHHHAHIAAVCAEHSVTEPVLGLALDGVGLGTDGSAWGGELLRVDGSKPLARGRERGWGEGWQGETPIELGCTSPHPQPFPRLRGKGADTHHSCQSDNGFQRIGHLRPLPLAGGDKAAQEPWRMAAAVLHELGRSDDIMRRYADEPAAATVVTMLQRNLNCPRTSSMGRVFDAAAGLLCLCHKMEFEAQAAIALEQSATRHIATHGWPQPLPDGWRIAENGGLDLLPLFAVLADMKDAEQGAALFHATVIAALTAQVRLAVQRTGITAIACGGGCFFNKLLSAGLHEQFAAMKVRMLTAQNVLPGDTAIALGQAWVASQRG